MCVRSAAIFINPYVPGHTCEPMKPMKNNREFIQKTKKSSKVKTAVRPGVHVLSRNPFCVYCVYIIIGHNNQIFKKRILRSGPALSGQCLPSHRPGHGRRSHRRSPPAWPQRRLGVRVSLPGWADSESTCRVTVVTLTRLGESPCWAPGRRRQCCRSHGQAAGSDGRPRAAGPGPGGRNLAMTSAAAPTRSHSGWQPESQACQ